MRLLVGLGNPGTGFHGTRHNIGFEIVDSIHCRWGIIWEKDAHQGILTKIRMEDQEILTLKPATFMNESGQSVRSALGFYKISLGDMLVIHDELELPLAQVKIKNGGSAGGHKGVKSIISNTGEQFSRLRFGIDRPNTREQVRNYVLERFSPEELEKVESKVHLVAEYSHLLFQHELFSQAVLHTPVVPKRGDHAI